jgi:gamma-glutamyl:cysteine ligase YbdK (ATP-grasp superfamily)
MWHALGYGADEQMVVTFTRDGRAMANKVANLASSCFPAATSASFSCLCGQLFLPLSLYLG